MPELEVSFEDKERYYHPEPCPFCGSERLEFDQKKTGTVNYEIWITCIDCGGSGPVAGTFIYMIEAYQKAVDRWNLRGEK